MMTWRLARSLEVLRAEIRSISPQTEFGTIGDPAHQAEASDHNPNAAGVVCALDIMAGYGLDLAAIAEAVRRSGHPDLKYVIYNRQIASRTSFAWRAYSGSDPHTGHVHVSVGIGPDGRSRQPYDDLFPWGIAPAPPSTVEETMVFRRFGLAIYRETIDPATRRPVLDHVSEAEWKGFSAAGLTYIQAATDTPDWTAWLDGSKTPPPTFSSGGSADHTHSIPSTTTGPATASGTAIPES